MPCRPSFCQHELSTAVGRAYRTMPCVFLHAGQLLDEGVDAVSNLIANRPDLFECLAGRVVEFPVLVVLAGQERAGVAAAHRDDDIGSQDELVGPWLGELSRYVDAYLGHRREHAGIDAGAWF